MAANCEKVVSDLFAAWARFDLDGIMSYFAEDAVWDNVPMAPAIPIMAGAPSGRANSRKPGVGSGRGCAGRSPAGYQVAAVALTSKYFTSPVILSASLGTPSTDANPPPLARWQSRQWQLAVNTGSAEHS